jgi:3-oxoacyl-[acyl-carrier protein] reductase
MNASFAGSVTLVTGASKGIGRAVVEQIAERGGTVVLNVEAESLIPRDLLARLEAANVPHLVAVADVADRADVDRMAGAALDRFGRIDALINNAAIFPRALAVELDEETWDRTIAINLKGAWLCCRAVLPSMIARRSGRIVNISSGAGFRGSVRGAHYAATKAGLVGFTRALALEVAPYGIAVNAVAPGLTDTDQPRGGMTEDEIREAAAGNPSGRMATAADIARAILYLASPESDYITGQTLHVNGGGFLS